MLPFRLIRSGVLLAGMLTTLGGTLEAAEDAFIATLSPSEREAAGLTDLSSAELDALDELIADDQTEARRLRVSLLPGSLADRHAADRVEAAGLDRLTPVQRTKLDSLVAGNLVTRRVPQERPRLHSSAMLSEQGRLRVHGGFSFTVGTGSSGSFHGATGWVSTYDPVTGLGLSFSYSNYSGPGYYDPSGGYGYGRGYATPAGYYSANPRFQFARTGYLDPLARPADGFDEDGLLVRNPLLTPRR